MGRRFVVMGVERNSSIRSVSGTGSMVSGLHGGVAIINEEVNEGWRSRRGTQPIRVIGYRREKRKIEFSEKARRKADERRGNRGG